MSGVLLVTDQRLLLPDDLTRGDGPGGKHPQAPALAKEMVERNLAACVHLLPAGESYYQWEGQLCHEPEVTLLLKIPQANAMEAQRVILAQHPYELPELIAIPIDEAGSLAEYLAWVRQIGDARQAPSDKDDLDLKI